MKKNLIFAILALVLLATVWAQHVKIDRLESQIVSLEACNTTLENRLDLCRDTLDEIYGTDWLAEIETMNRNTDF